MGSGGQRRAAGRPGWYGLTHGAFGGGLAQGGGSGPPAAHHSLKLDAASEGEDLCPEDPAGAPRGWLENQGDGVMAGRVWQGLGVSASFPASPLPHCLSHHTGCDNSHSSALGSLVTQHLQQISGKPAGRLFRGAWVMALRLRPSHFLQNLSISTHQPKAAYLQYLF